MKRWLVAAFVVGACGHPAAPPAPPHAASRDAGADATPRPLDDDLPRLAERGAQLQRDLLAALTAAGTDCAAAAAKVEALADANADVIAANAKIARAGHDKIKALRAALAPHAEELDTSASQIASAITASNCAGDAAFSKAFDRLEGPP